jgi:hypothetical protein
MTWDFPAGGKFRTGAARDNLRKSSAHRARRSCCSCRFVSLRWVRIRRRSSTRSAARARSFSAIAARSFAILARRSSTVLTVGRLEYISDIVAYGSWVVAYGLGLAVSGRHEIKRAGAVTSTPGAFFSFSPELNLPWAPAATWLGDAPSVFAQLIVARGGINQRVAVRRLDNRQVELYYLLLEGPPPQRDTSRVCKPRGAISPKKRY